jgi:hypothetical protein
VSSVEMAVGHEFLPTNSSDLIIRQENLFVVLLLVVAVQKARDTYIGLRPTP